MSVRAVIFDLDGTLTRPVLDFDRIRREMELPDDAGPILEALERVDENHRRRALQVLLRHEQSAVERSSLNPGVRHTVGVLRQWGIKMGVLTRNLAEHAWEVLNRHHLKVDAVLGRGDGPVKPDPYGVRRLCEQFGVSPREAVMVGDYLFDLQSARAAGAMSVLLAHGGSLPDFAEKADCVVRRFPEILDYIRSNR